MLKKYYKTEKLSTPLDSINLQKHSNPQILIFLLSKNALINIYSIFYANKYKISINLRQF